MNAYDYIMKDLKETITNMDDLYNIRDNSGEWIDGYIPVYNNQIIEEWQNMPGEYDDRGAEELGHMRDITIIGLMRLDLYIYYSELFFQILDDMQKELESVA